MHSCIFVNQLWQGGLTIFVDLCSIQCLPQYQNIRLVTYYVMMMRHKNHNLLSSINTILNETYQTIFRGGLLNLYRFILYSLSTGHSRESNTVTFIVSNSTTYIHKSVRHALCIYLIFYCKYKVSVAWIVPEQDTTSSHL